MRRSLLFVLAIAASCALVAHAAAAPDATRCTPTPEDGFGPFGRGMPPLRAKIGTGHVLTGVVLSALDCRPLSGARVELWQERNGSYTRATSGTVVTDRTGRFRFEGPRPSPYEGREAHIHLRVVAPLHQPLLTRYVPAKGARRGSVRLVLRPEEL